MNIRSTDAAYLIPRDALRIRTTESRVLALADRLWERAPVGTVIDRRIPPALSFTIAVFPAATTRTPLEESWRVAAHEAELTLGSELGARLDMTRGVLEARVSDRLLAEEPSLVTRLLLETPAAALLARRGYGVLHAGVVVGPAGAIVLRGAASAGKSTLVAAAYRAGMDVLGDETVLVARDDPDDLLAGVRDITLLPASTRLLGLERLVVPTLGKDGEPKHRIDLASGSTPARRHARRVATVLLGSWQDRPARLERLRPIEFLRRFTEGAIVQEHWSGTPPEIAAAWAERGNVYRLSGAADLRGALALLSHLVSLPAAAHRA